MSRIHAGLAALMLICFGLAAVGVLLTSQTYALYQDDLANNREECAAERKAKYQNNSKECQSFLYRSLDDPVALFTGALVVATLALFGVTGLLYAAAVAQGRDAREAIIITRSASERQLRAYIAIKNARWKLENGTKLWIELDVHNFGQTPGHKVTNVPQTYIVDRSGIITNTETYGTRYYGSMMPGSYGTPRMPVNGMFLRRQRERVTTRDIIVYVSGQIDYIDTFHQNQMTKYKYAVIADLTKDSEGSLMICPDGNDAT